MSAPSAAPRGIDPHLGSIPFRREVAVELRKLVGTRGPWILLGLLALVWIATLLVMVAGASPTFSGSVEGFGATTRIFVAILAILLVTSEWGQRSVLTAFTLEPRRERVIAAKFTAALIGAGTLFLAAVALSAVIVALRGGSFDGAAQALRYNGIRALFDVLMAFAMALAVLNTAGAIVAYLVLPEIVVPALLFLFSFSASNAQPGFEGRSSLFSSLAPWVYPQDALSSFNSVAVGAQDWAHLLVCAVIWIGVPGLLGVYRVMTSEVK